MMSFMEVVGWVVCTHFVVSFILFLITPRNTRIHKYFRNTMIAYDQGLNVIFLLGDPDETISSVCAKRVTEWGWKELGKFLEWVDPGHLEESIEHDEGKNSLRR